MDQRLREFARRARAAPEDLEGLRAYRAALDRAAPGLPDAGRALRRELEGVFCCPRSNGQDLDEREPLLPEWRRAGAPGRRPLLAPRLDPDARLAPRWGAAGTALWVSAQVVLLRERDQALVARCPRSGELLWRVPSLRPAADALETDERGEALPWAVAPWGAVELCARFEAPFAFRRVGRHHPTLGRVTERRAVDRDEAEIELFLQLALPAGGWSRAEPELLREEAGGEVGLCDSELVLDSWNDVLLDLEVDLDASVFGVRWRDRHQDWAILALSGGGDLPWSVGPAPWTLGSRETLLPRQVRDALGCAGPFGRRHEVRAGELVEIEAGGASGRRLRLPALELAGLLPVDGATLLLPVEPEREVPQVLDWERWELRPWAGFSQLGELLEGRRLAPWSSGSPDEARMLVADGRVFLQLGPGDWVCAARESA